MAPVSRRSFLAGLIAAPVLAALPSPPKTVALKAGPTDPTLTGRILRTLKHRKQLGQVSAAIYISGDDHNRIQVEHGCEPELSMDLSLRGVPCVRVRTLKADEYWVVEDHDPESIARHNAGWFGVMRG